MLGLALAYGGLAQLLAGMWEFRTGNTFGAVAFTSFGAFWLSFWAFEQFFANEIPRPTPAHAVGLYLIAWGDLHHVHVRRLAADDRRRSRSCSCCWPSRSSCSASATPARTRDIMKAGGYVGLATAVAAWYASFAAVTNSTFGRTVLPVRRRWLSRVATSDSEEEEPR